MKLKHFQGYGTVNAKRVENVVLYEGQYDRWKRLTVEVSGDHEWGLDCYRGWDNVCVFNWLGRRFAKDLTDYRQIKRIDTEYVYADVETMRYTILYEVTKDIWG